jgi:hypothetical protein
VESLLTRAEVLRRSNGDGTKDVAAALKVDPKSIYALMMRADLESHADKHDQAIQTLSTALLGESPPELRARLILMRAIEYFHIGEPTARRARAGRRIGRRRQRAIVEQRLLGTGLANVALERALSYCNRAVTLEPGSAPSLDSKGLVLLRMNRPGRIDPRLRRRVAHRAEFVTLALRPRACSPGALQLRSGRSRYQEGLAARSVTEPQFRARGTGAEIPAEYQTDRAEPESSAS